MRHALRSTLLSVFLPVSLAGAALLTGCGTGPLAPSASETAQPVTISGSVHGGQQPVVGARVFIFQASGFGYGGSAYDAIFQQYNGSAYPANVAYDSQLRAYYLTTDAQGAFSITGNYRCIDNRPLYLLATQGNPGLAAGKSNPALAELAVLGYCPAGTTLPSTVQLQLNELTTVAGVYALSGYLTGPNYLSARTDPNGGVSPSDVGLNNAALTALSLFNTSTGSLLASTAAGGVVPTARINLLADILAACINTDGTGTACTTLFANATSDGTSTGTKPTDTVTALLNIAHSPGTNVAALAALVTANSRYQPTPIRTPTDLSLAVTYPIQYTSSGTSGSQTVALNPNLPTIDASGNIVVPAVESSNGTLSGATQVFNNLGKPVAYSNRSTSTAPFAANKWAIDAQGNAWAAPTAVQGSTASFARLTPSSGAITTYPQTLAPTTAYDVAIDPSGNVYFPDSVTSQLNEYSSSGTQIQARGVGSLGIAIDSGNTLYSSSASPNTIYFGQGYPATGGGLTNPSLLAVDNNQGLWVANANNSLSKFTLTNGATLTPVSPTSGFTGGGLAFNPSVQPYIQVSMDGLSHAWVPNYAGKSISQFSSAGTSLSPAATSTFAGGFQTGCSPKGMAIDGSGNVWVTCDNPAFTADAQSLVEFIGLAAPLATPILPNQTGTRP